jgi:hypothetical protein
VTEQPEGFPGDTTPLGSAAGDLKVLDPPLDQWRADLDGLLELGALSGSFTWCGHRLVIKTLSTDEELIAAVLMKEFGDTVGGPKAYATSIACLALQFVDDQPLPAPLGETGSKHQWAQERFRWARRLYPPTIDAIYDAYLELERRQRKVLEELGKSSGPGAGASPGPSPGSGPPTGEASSPAPPSP